VGTNGEIVLGSAVRTIATAAPAGPAFEGAEIKHGMRAAEGAIEAVVINRDSVRVEVIGSVPPVGLCGSGMLDAVAQLRLVGLVDATGKLMEHDVASHDYPEHLVRRLISDERGERAFVLVWHEASGSDHPITLTQRDIRQLQFAKGAIASGVAVLMDELGVAANDLVEVFLAGSFGTYINPVSARVTGLVPPIPVERIRAIGNAAGEGAKMALLSFRERQVAHALPHIVEYHELSGRAGFNDAFIDVLQFPELADLDTD
jgi:uncharacterized 2Fe-2S/4Fe-4S cluster protein (DUF4445 family)